MRVQRLIGSAGTALFLLIAAVADGQAAHRARLIVETGQSPVNSVAISSDGKFVLTGHDDHTARLWDVTTGMELRRFAEHTGGVNTVALSPDGHQVLTGSNDGTARLWDVRTAVELGSFRGSGGVNAVAFSPDGRRIALGNDGGIAQLWDVRTCLMTRQFHTGSGDVQSLAFSRDGRSLLVGMSTGEAQMWRVKGAKKMPQHFEGGLSVAFSPDSRYVLTGDISTIARLWDANTGEELRHFDVDTAALSVAFSPDGGTVVTGNRDGSVQLWDVKTAVELHRFSGHSSFVNAVAFSLDGGKVLSGSSDGTARLWMIKTGMEMERFQGHSDVVSSVAFASDGINILTGNGGNETRLWDTSLGKQTERFIGHTASVSAVAFSSDGHKAISSSRDETTRLWDIETATELQRFEGHASGELGSVALSPDGTRALTGSNDNTAQLWDVKTGEALQRFAGHTLLVSSVAFSQDGQKVLTGSWDQTARLWDVATAKTLMKYEGHTMFVNAASLSNDGHTVLTGSSDTTARLWNAETGVEVRRFQGHSSPVYSVDISPDGHTVLTGSADNTARLWDVLTSETLHVFAGHSAGVNSVTFCPKRQCVLTGSDDGTARLWSTDTGEELAALVSFRDGGWAVIDSLGRFDTSDLDGDAPMHWVVDDDPMRPLPLEIFMRDYYTPGLLTRVMKGETLPPLRSIAEITDRVQPQVSVKSVTASATIPERVDVVVHAESDSEPNRDEHGNPIRDARGNMEMQSSGLRDLRLFRDGQMVADGYREGKLDDGDYVFRNVMLKSDAKKVTFTAYAFSTERIKSPTASLDYEIKTPSMTPPRRRAFLLQVGVNHYAAQECDLKYSVKDAEKMSADLSERLRAQGFDVEAIKLESVAESDVQGAAKETIHARLAEIAATANPDDVLFVSFSGHGYSAANGTFYVLPSNIEGSCKDAANLKNMISADELANWLRPIDAGEMTLILDACESAASVQSGGFKPGPLGSKGLGQLAYDKRMRILAASQSDEVAHEYDYLQHGLLTYVLTHDGLEKKQADWKPRNGTITLAEWLSYAEFAVPKFLPYAAMTSTHRSAVDRFRSDNNKTIQIPALFDFSKTDSLRLQ